MAQDARRGDRGVRVAARKHTRNAVAAVGASRPRGVDLEGLGGKETHGLLSSPSRECSPAMRIAAARSRVPSSGAPWDTADVLSGNLRNPRNSHDCPQNNSTLAAVHPFGVALPAPREGRHRSGARDGVHRRQHRRHAEQKGTRVPDPRRGVPAFAVRTKRNKPGMQSADAFRCSSPPHPPLVCLCVVFSDPPGPTPDCPRIHSASPPVPLATRVTASACCNGNPFVSF